MTKYVALQAIFGLSICGIEWFSTVVSIAKSTQTHYLPIRLPSQTQSQTVVKPKSKEIHHSIENHSILKAGFSLARKRPRVAVTVEWKLNQS